MSQISRDFQYNFVNQRQLYFSNSKNLEEFYDTSIKFYNDLGKMIVQYPNLKFMIKNTSTESNQGLFAKMMNETQGRVFVETVDKGIQTPTHIIEKHIGK